MTTNEGRGKNGCPPPVISNGPTLKRKRKSSLVFFFTFEPCVRYFLNRYRNRNCFDHVSFFRFTVQQKFANTDVQAMDVIFVCTLYLKHFVSTSTPVGSLESLVHVIVGCRH